MVRNAAAKFSTNCPCCGQEMPATDFELYPKSMSVIRNGYVLMLGSLQFAIVAYLHRVYPEVVSAEQLFVHCYSGAKDFDKQRSNLHANVHWLRERLKKLRVSVVSVYGAGYRLHIDSWKEPK